MCFQSMEFAHFHVIHLIMENYERDPSHCAVWQIECSRLGMHIIEHKLSPTMDTNQNAEHSWPASIAYVDNLNNISSSRSVILVVCYSVIPLNEIQK